MNNTFRTQKTIQSKASFQTHRHKTIEPENSRNNSVGICNYAFLEARKESQLNSMFNIRKNRLENITKANRLIHDKINEIESHYPQRRVRGKTTVLKSLNDLGFKSKELMPCQREILGPISRFEELKVSNRFELFMDGKKAKSMMRK